jgi:alkylated DNA repair dioxygenase AlkB
VLCRVVQTELFGGGQRALVDDSTGTITYTPEIIDAATAASWYQALLDRVDWRSERRWMYDRRVDVPRLVAGYRLDEDAVPVPLLDARDIVAAACGVGFNSVGLNLYRDGHDSVAPHNDHIDEIRPGFPIALLSLGATRLMTIRSKDRPRRSYDVDLEPGSLLVMSYETQFRYDHGIPKTAAPVGNRISLAFRVRPSELTRREKQRARRDPDA